MFFALRDAVTRVRAERGLKKSLALNSPLTAEQIRAGCADGFTDMVIRRWGKDLFKFLWVKVHAASGTWNGGCLMMSPHFVHSIWLLVTEMSGKRPHSHKLFKQMPFEHCIGISLIFYSVFFL